MFLGKKKKILESLHESGLILPAEKCFQLHGQLQRWWILESLDHELALALHDQRPGQEDSGACVYYMRMIHAHVYYILTSFAHVILVLCSAPPICFFQGVEKSGSSLQKLPPFMFHPNSRQRAVWDTVIAFILMSVSLPQPLFVTIFYIVCLSIIHIFCLSYFSLRISSARPFPAPPSLSRN